MTQVTRVDSGVTTDGSGNYVHGPITVTTEDNGDGIVFPTAKEYTNSLGQLVIDTRGVTAMPPNPLLSAVHSSTSQQNVLVDTLNATIVPPGAEIDNPYVKTMSVTTVETHMPEGVEPVTAPPVEEQPAISPLTGLRVANPNAALVEIQNVHEALNANAHGEPQPEPEPVPEPRQVTTATQSNNTTDTPQASHIDPADHSAVEPLHAEPVVTTTNPVH